MLCKGREASHIILASHIIFVWSVLPYFLGWAPGGGGCGGATYPTCPATCELREGKKDDTGHDDLGYHGIFCNDTPVLSRTFTTETEVSPLRKGIPFEAGPAEAWDQNTPGCGAVQVCCVPQAIPPVGVVQKALQGVQAQNECENMQTLNIDIHVMCSLAIYQYKFGAFGHSASTGGRSLLQFHKQCCLMCNRLHIKMCMHACI
jgi:hypothetical protein